MNGCNDSRALRQPAAPDAGGARPGGGALPLAPAFLSLTGDRSGAARAARTRLRRLDRGGLLEAELVDRLLAHPVLLDFPGDRHREAVHELVVARDLVRRDLALAEGADLLAHERDPGTQLHPRHELLAVL